LQNLLFFSIIYDATRGDNEDQSAIIFEEFAKDTNLSQSEIEYTKKIILATKSHMSHNDLSIAENWTLFVFLDLDLSILGSPREEYINYARAIRQEYIIFNDEVFCRERAKFLDKMVTLVEEQNRHLYYTEVMRNIFEKVAIDNMKYESSQLKKGQTL
jgi:predicted metal-dependent HD superfamily phosphohydrolase